MEKYTAASVCKRKKGWQARLRYKEGKTWKELSKMLPEAKGKKEAEKMAEDLRQNLNKVAENEAIAAEDRTVDEVVMDFLDYQFSIGELESSTYSRQVSTYNSSIKPYLGDYGFKSVDRTVVKDWHTKLARLGRKPQTIYIYYQLMSKVYRYYMDQKIISDNPFSRVKSLSRSKSVKTTHLTKEQMETFLNSVFAEFEPEDPMYAAMVLALYSGCRRGELLALRWYDVNFKENTISITSAIGKGVGGSYTKGPKNESSLRTIPMANQLTYCLKLRYEAIQPQDNWFVCGYEDRFMPVSTFSEKAKKFFDAYNLVDAYGEPLRIGGLRHNFATLGVSENVDIKSLSMMMGHANAARTLNVYADAMKQSKAITMERLSEAFSKYTDDVDYYPEDE